MSIGIPTIAISARQSVLSPAVHAPASSTISGDVVGRWATMAIKGPKAFELPRRDG
jgi:hypothetical protein